eukprot:7340821-Prorocentrum_lima.AAC.1
MCTLIANLSAQPESQTDRLANSISKVKDDLEQRSVQQQERIEQLEAQVVKVGGMQAPTYSAAAQGK